MIQSKTYGWYIHENTIYHDNFSTVPFQLKGLNWFGFESNCRVLHGLWTRSFDSFFDFLHENKYNALRIPFSYELITTWNIPALSTCLSSNPWMIPLSVKQLFHVLFEKSHEYGIQIVLDYHTINNIITESIYEQGMTREKYIDMWITILEQFSHYPNLLGIDLKNEPHGSLTWDKWIDVIEDVVHNVREQMPYYRGLYIIEGLEEYNSSWGGSIQGISTYKNRFDEFWNSTDMIFSCHVYGVSVRGMHTLNESTSKYDEWFGNNSFSGNIIIGEFGGWYISEDALWQDSMVDYFLSRNITQLFYWSLNPDSHDTGGILLDNWYNTNDAKIRLHEKLQPTPTFYIQNTLKTWMT